MGRVETSRVVLYQKVGPYNIRLHGLLHVLLNIITPSRISTRKLSTNNYHPVTKQDIGKEEMKIDFGYGSTLYCRFLVTP